MRMGCLGIPIVPHEDNLPCGVLPHGIHEFDILVRRADFRQHGEQALIRGRAFVASAEQRRMLVSGNGEGTKGDAVLDPCLDVFNKSGLRRLIGNQSQQNGNGEPCRAQRYGNPRSDFHFSETQHWRSPDSRFITFLFGMFLFYSTFGDFPYEKSSKSQKKGSPLSRKALTVSFLGRLYADRANIITLSLSRKRSRARKRRPACRSGSRTRRRRRGCP